MPERDSHRLAELVEALTTKDGVSSTSVPGVDLWKASAPMARTPAIYTPRIIIIAQGRKQAWLGDQCFVYDPEHLLVLSVPMPFECETTASPEEPLLGLSIAVDPMLVGELLLEMGDAVGDEPASYVSSAALNREVMDAAVRLAEALSSPADCRILAPQIVREIVYRVLASEDGKVLRLLTAQPNRHGQIARVLRRIHGEYASDLDVASLAREANMGVSSFHQAFKDDKEIISISPNDDSRLKRITLQRRG